MSFLEAARGYIEDGIAIFPLVPRGKRPATPNGFKDAALDAGPWATGDLNLGIATGQMSGGLCVLDIDPAKGGNESLKALLEDRQVSPEAIVTYTVRTGGGGRHLYFYAPEGAQIGCRSFGNAYPGIDVRGDGGYVVAPPSVHASGKAYEVELAIAPIEWPLALLPPAHVKRPELETEGDVTCERVENALVRAKIHLAAMPPSVEGQNGSRGAFRAAVACFQFGLTAEEVFSLLSSDFNPRCKPPWSEAELTHKVLSALTTSPIARDGVARRDHLVAKLLPESWPKSEHAPDSTPEPEETFCYFLPFERFVFRSAGRWRTETPLGTEGMQYALIDLGHDVDKAKEIITSKACDTAWGVGCVASADAFVRDPENPKKRLLNTYVVPTLVPKAGPSPTIDRLLSMLTGNDEQGIFWLKNWIAAKVQRPTVRGQVAVSLYSKHTGTGKTSLGKIMMAILGEGNCAEIGQSDLNSDFNESFAQYLFVVANEAFSTDHLQDQQARMRALVTDARIVVNQKNVKRYAIPNRIAWLFTSNLRNAVQPQGETDRRYTIFESGEPDGNYKAELVAMYGADLDFSEVGRQEVAAFAAELYAMTVDWRLAATPYANDARAALVEYVKTPEEQFLEECGRIGPAEVVRQNPPEWWRAARPPDSEWDFGEHGIAQMVLGGALQTYCKRNSKPPVSTQRLTAAAHACGITVKQIGIGKRPRVYAGWRTPEVEIEITKSGRLLRAVHEESAIDHLRGLTSTAFSGNILPAL